MPLMKISTDLPKPQGGIEFPQGTRSICQPRNCHCPPKTRWTARALTESAHEPPYLGLYCYLWRTKSERQLQILVSTNNEDAMTTWQTVPGSVTHGTSPTYPNKISAQGSLFVCPSVWHVSTCRRGKASSPHSAGIWIILPSRSQCHWHLGGGRSVTCVHRRTRGRRSHATYTRIC